MLPRLSRLHAVAALGAGATWKVSAVQPTSTMQHPSPLMQAHAELPQVKMPPRKFVPIQWYDRIKSGLSACHMYLMHGNPPPLVDVEDVPPKEQMERWGFR